MTIRFREHRGNLADSMKTTRSFATVDDLLTHLVINSPHPIRDVSKIIAKSYGGDDDRIGWRDVHLVLSDLGQPLGFVEGPIFSPPQTKKDPTRPD